MHPRLARLLLNAWPPLLFSGIRSNISTDFRSASAELRLRWWNRNAAGTLFGGSLFALTDPFYALMLQHCLGRNYVVWDESAHIAFVAPGRGVARARFQLTDDRLAEIRDATSGGDKSLPSFTVEVVDDAGALLARVKRTVYVRRRALRPSSAKTPSP